MSFFLTSLKKNITVPKIREFVLSPSLCYFNIVVTTAKLEKSIGRIYGAQVN